MQVTEARVKPPRIPTRYACPDAPLSSNDFRINLVTILRFTAAKFVISSKRFPFAWLVAILRSYLKNQPTRAKLLAMATRSLLKPMGEFLVRVDVQVAVMISFYQ